MKKTSKKIGIYCDLSPSSGLGHIRRMEFLVSELEKLGRECFFLFNKNNSKFIKNFTKNLNVIFFSNKNKSELDQVKILSLRLGISIMIFDSYKIDIQWEKEFIKEDIFVVSIDDHLTKHASQIVVSNRAAINNQNLIKNNQTWLVGSKYLLISKNKKRKKIFITKNFKPKIILHAGGSSDYKSIKHFTESAIKASRTFDLKIDILCSTIDSKDYIKKMCKKYKVTKNLNLLNYSNNFSDIICNYDILVGPSGTTTFEAISAGVLTYSVPLKNDGRDSPSSWSNIGHLMHLTSDEKNNKQLLDSSWALIIEKYWSLLKFLKNNSKLVDGVGPKRLAKKIINIEKNKNQKIDRIKMQENMKASLCKAVHIRDYFNSRNKKQTRILSSQPNHLIIWPEHVKWWIRKDILKYSLIINGLPAAYHWTKLLSDNKGKFIVSGWFLSGNFPDKLKIANDILNFQYKSVKKTYNSLTWIIAMRDENKFVERLNKKFGFKDASNLSIIRASQIFFKSKDGFKVMEMKL